MRIICTDIAKKFRTEWLFRQLSFTFENGNKYAITGPNSSGKSSLLKILGGALEPTEGKIAYELNGKEVPPLEVYRYISFESPELQLFDAYTVQDMLDFHFGLKPAVLPVNQIIEAAELSGFKHKKFEELSSGLKNKLKLTLALFVDAPVLFLDEPCTNFDAANMVWYHQQIQSLWRDRTVIVASNQPDEYTYCDHIISISDHKNIPSKQT